MAQKALTAWRPFPSFTSPGVPAVCRLRDACVLSQRRHDGRVGSNVQSSFSPPAVGAVDPITASVRQWSSCGAGPGGTSGGLAPGTWITNAFRL